jgi:DNA-binding NtrC family response regulator
MNAKAKVLVVDDEEMVRASYLHMLAGRQCQVREVNNGLDALMLMQQQAFDVVLLDQKMPGIDGMVTLQSIKALWPETEVIMISGHPALASAKEALKLGAYDYLAKPLAAEKIIHATSSALTHKRWRLHQDVDLRSPVA